MIGIMQLLQNRRDYFIICNSTLKISKNSFSAATLYRCQINIETWRCVREFSCQMFAIYIDCTIHTMVGGLQIKISGGI